MNAPCTPSDKWKGWLLSFLILSPICIPAANADLLFSFTFSGTAGQNVISTNLYLPIGYQQSIIPFPPDPPQSLLFQLPWTIADAGTTRTETGATDANFNAFAALMTDGIREGILFTTALTPDIFLGPRIFSESTVVGHFPDLVGYRIDNISLTVNSLSINSPGSDPNHDGLWTDALFSLTLSANGAAIPEPSSLSLLVVAGVTLLIFRRFAVRPIRSHPSQH